MALSRTGAACLLALVLGVHCAAAAGSGRRQLREDKYKWCKNYEFNYEMPVRGTPPPPLSIDGHRIVNADTGNAVPIRGLNWFGFNVGMGMVDGLWAGGSEAATDFALIAYQIRLLGYNAVRLPFIWRDLEMPPKNLHKDCTPVSVDFVKRRLISPHVMHKYVDKPLPGNVSPQKKRQAGYCNQYLPETTNYHRLFFVTQSLVAQGIYVILDYQPMGLEQHPYNLKVFVDKWLDLWKQVSCLPNFHADLANRVFVDVMNEPDSMGVRWEASGDRPGAQQLYLGTADAIWAATPNKVMFMFEGTGQNGFGLNWGNGFVTDMEVIRNRGLSDATPFFRELVTKPYVHKVVITPHVYPPTITHATFLGTTLWEQCRTSFGYLQEKGFCATPGECKVFPILIGETGSAMETAEDKQWLQDFADFINAEGEAKAYNSVPANGWNWWAYNENSGDTGGIVYHYWQDINWEKVNFMIARFGLRPWYLRL
ncbi:MAG: glycoside hydrolase superfamily [Monoraphidium minutum]|nr:MAG: glycoside hydrolase superfamily [Monoraphidium minutum]